MAVSPDKLVRAAKLFTDYHKEADLCERVGKATLDHDIIAKGLKYRQNANQMQRWMQSQQLVKGAMASLAYDPRSTLPKRKSWNGIGVVIENQAGSYREWKDPDEKRTGVTYMWYDYGYFKKSSAIDGDEVDCYFGPLADDLTKAPFVYVVRQMKAPDFTTYDEDKCMVGFASQDSARQAYKMQYDDKRFLGDIDAYLIDTFVAALKSTHKAPQPVGDWNALNVPCRIQDILKDASIPDQVVITDEDKKRMADELQDKYSSMFDSAISYLSSDYSTTQDAARELT